LATGFIHLMGFVVAGLVVAAFVKTASPASIAARSAA
jgi:hypothetical protein